MDLLDAVIVGAGFSGLAMAIRLREQGRRAFVVLEKSEGLGGTWRDNDYPGCACDVPSHLYSYSFAPNPGWTRRFAPQPEILAYLQGCADRHDLGPHLRFGQEVVEAAFDEGLGAWRVRTASGEVFLGRHLVLGTGGLHEPAWPAIPGLERFGGAAFHSARWDHATPLDGRRVGVIGTGASAIQFIPEIAPRVGRLHVFQRTPPWVLPRHDRPIGRGRRALFRALPLAQRLARYGLYWTLETRGAGFTVNPRAMALATLIARRHLRRQVPDPVLRDKLTPRYQAGCKRLLLSDDYYPALQHPQVEVVTDPVAEITEEGVRTRDDRLRELDVLIFATGFDPTGPLRRCRVTGRGGLDLREAWRQGAEAWRGTMMPGFPQLYFLMGPNTGLGHSSMVFMIESQVTLVAALMAEVRRRGSRFAEVRPEAHASWNARLQARLSRTIWASGCQSWYLDGNGRNATLWPGTTLEFWARTRRLPLHELHFEPKGAP